MALFFIKMNLQFGKDLWPEMIHMQPCRSVYLCDLLHKLLRHLHNCCVELSKNIKEMRSIENHTKDAATHTFLL